MLDSQVVVIGGGRWARQIILTLLLKINLKKVYCLTNNKNFFIRKWSEKKKIKKKIKFLKNLSIASTKKSLAIICNNSLKHYSSAVLALKNNYNVLIEKPIVSNISEAEIINTLSKKKNRKVFCSSVYSFSNYIMKILENIKRKKISYINFRWHDKFNEVRYGEKKIINKNVPIHLDLFFHIFSILDVIINDKAYRNVIIKKKSFTNNKLILVLKFKSLTININLNRLAKKRCRLISFINNENKFFLNFNNNEGRYSETANKHLLVKKVIKNLNSPLHLMLKYVLNNIKLNSKYNKLNINIAIKHFKRIKKIFC